MAWDGSVGLGDQKDWGEGNGVGTLASVFNFTACHCYRGEIVRRQPE